MIKKMITIFITVSILIGIAPSLAGAATATDTPSAWARDDVKTAISMGIVPQRLQSNYQSPITREEFAELIVKTMFNKIKREQMMGGLDVYWTPERLLNQVTLDFEFEDAKQDHVKLAFILGSINGITDTEFAPDRYITRQEAATMLVNTSHIANGIAYVNPASLNYSDFDEIADWAKPAIQAAKSVHLMYGVGSNFDYNGKFTREQSISTMLRLDKGSYVFCLRGNMRAYPEFTELHYNIGRDYIKVNYTEDHAQTPLDDHIESQWNINIGQNDEIYTVEKAIALFAFGAEVKTRDNPGSIKPTINGESSSWDYGYMTTSIFNEDSIIKFTFKPIRGYMTRTAGYKYGYPFVPVTAKEIK